MRIPAKTLAALVMATTLARSLCAQNQTPRRVQAVPVAPEAPAAPAAAADPAKRPELFAADSRTGTGVFLNDGNLFVQSLKGAAVKKEKGTYMGVTISPATPALRSQLALKPGFGVVVETVDEDSPAKTAGLKRFDVLTKFDDQLLINSDQFLVLLRAKNPGESVNLSLLREGKPLTVNAPTVEKEVTPITDLVPGLGYNNGLFTLGKNLPQMQAQVAQAQAQLARTQGDIARKNIALTITRSPSSAAWRGYAKKQILDDVSGQTWTFSWNNGAQMEWNYKENGHTYSGVSPLLDADKKDLTLPEQVKTALDAYLARKKNTLDDIIKSITPATVEAAKTTTTVVPGM